VSGFNELRRDYSTVNPTIQEKNLEHRPACQIGPEGRIGPTRRYLRHPRPSQTGQDGLVDLAETCYRSEIMDRIDEDLWRKIRLLVDTYRDRCLWFLRPDYYPTDRQEALRTLDYIRRYGDREAFRKAGELYRWLSPNSSETSAAS
jgi:hypothetical protein